MVRVSGFLGCLNHDQKRCLADPWRYDDSVRNNTKRVRFFEKGTS